MQWGTSIRRTGNDANDGPHPCDRIRQRPARHSRRRRRRQRAHRPGAYDQSLPKQISLLRQANVSVAVIGGH